MTPSAKAQALLDTERGRKHEDEDFKAAEAASKRMLASILGQKKSGGLPSTAGSRHFYGSGGERCPICESIIFLLHA